MNERWTVFRGYRARGRQIRRLQAELDKTRADLGEFRDNWTITGDSTWRWLNRIIHGYRTPSDPWTDEDDLDRWLRADGVDGEDAL
jgi:hypothetical protein